MVMTTTIQMSEKALIVLKRLKQEMNAASYEEAIMKMASQRKRKSLAGILGPMSTKEILKDLRDKNDRF